MIVFNRGIAIGLKEEIPLQGHVCPMKMSGERDEWKNDQKNDRKKNTSDVINKIIPSFNPFITSFVCRFSNVASRITSRHHKKATTNMSKIVINKK